VDHLLTFMLPVPEDRPTTPEKARQFYGELLRRVRALPGVSSAAVSTSMPLQRGVPLLLAASGSTA
jgi:putative ABC transport system permease protein